MRECGADTNLRIAAEPALLGCLTLDEPTAGLQKFVVTHRNKIFQFSGEARRVARPKASD